MFSILKEAMWMTKPSPNKTLTACFRRIFPIRTGRWLSHLHRTSAILTTRRRAAATCGAPHRHTSRLSPTRNCSSNGIVAGNFFVAIMFAFEAFAFTFLNVPHPLKLRLPGTQVLLVFMKERFFQFFSTHAALGVDHGWGSPSFSVLCHDFFTFGL